MEDLQLQLNKLWAGIIKKLEFDFLNDRIQLSVEVREGSKVDAFEVVFNEVSSHYYLKNNGSERFTFFEAEEGDYLELTSIEYYQSGIGDITIDSLQHGWTDDYYSKANFLLEIWSSVLFIEAKTLKITDKSYTNLL